MLSVRKVGGRRGELLLPYILRNGVWWGRNEKHHTLIKGSNVMNLRHVRRTLCQPHAERAVRGRCCSVECTMPMLL